MQVAQYTFQSPSSSPVQVGKIDPSSLKAESSQSNTPPNETAQKAADFAKTEVSEVKPTASQYALDTYA
jgi:hypothetical protein